MTFKPTYKYLAMKSEYDVNRVPAYTDRIFFEARYPMPQQNPLMNIYYGDVQYLLSDHMPITALFEAKIKVQNQDKKSKLIDKYIEQFESDAVFWEQQRKQDLISHLNIMRDMGNENPGFDVVNQEDLDQHFEENFDELPKVEEFKTEE